MLTRNTKNGLLKKIVENVKAVPAYYGTKKKTKERLMNNTQSIMDANRFSQDNDNPENMGARRYARAFTNIYKKFNKGDAQGAENYIKEQKEKIRKQRLSNNNY